MKDTPFARDMSRLGMAEGDIARFQRFGAGLGGLLGPEAVKHAFKTYTGWGKDKLDQWARQRAATNQAYQERKNPVPGERPEEAIRRKAGALGTEAGASTRKGYEGAKKAGKSAIKVGKKVGEKTYQAGKDVVTAGSAAGKGFYEGLTTDPNQSPPPPSPPPYEGTGTEPALPKPPRPEIPWDYGEETARKGVRHGEPNMTDAGWDWRTDSPAQSPAAFDAAAPGWHAPMAPGHIPPPQPWYRGQLSVPYTDQEFQDRWDKSQAILRRGVYSPDYRDRGGSHYYSRKDSMKNAKKNKSSVLEDMLGFFFR
jgi:hypothetical protein